MQTIFWRFPIFFVLTLNCSYGQSLSPEILSSTGDSFSQAGFKLDWTLGELTSETLSSGERIVTQGFHQRDLHIVTSLETTLQPEISIYPIPAKDQVNYLFEKFNEENEKWMYSILDITGKLMEKGSIERREGQIMLNNIPSGAFLLVLNHGDLARVFRLIKL